MSYQSSHDEFTVEKALLAQNIELISEWIKALLPYEGL